MDKQPHSPALRFTAVILVLLPIGYLVSYLMLVKHDIPGSELPRMDDRYRLGNDYAEVLYWPLEQIDRKLRPAAWAPPPFDPWKDYRPPQNDS